MNARAATDRATASTAPPAGSARAAALAERPTGALHWRQLVTWLLADGVISLDEGKRIAQRFGAGDSAQHPLVRLGGAGLVHAKTGEVFDVETLTEWLARHCKLPYLRIDPLKVDVARVADVMSVNYAERRHALPVQVGLTEVVIATCEPFDTAWLPEIESHTKKTVQLALVSPPELARYTTEFYSLAKSVRSAQKNGQLAGPASFEQLVEMGKSSKQLDANDQGVVQIVDWLWQYAFDQRASDIHLEPRREMGAIRFRIDGVLHTVYQVPLQVMGAMTSRVKLLGRMDVVEKRRPLDGRIKTRRPVPEGGTPGATRDVEMRLSTLPTAFGEKMVMRIFDPDNAVKPLAGLGFAPHEAQMWEQLVTRPHGIVLVTGPTGSGKTTTLYSTLKRLATDEVNVCTVEDPIEMIEPAFNQTQVQASIDLGFAEGLRALMRQDPDIIMVGEIRDLETAEMAIQASLTGHLVFSTLHTNDAVASMTRLIDLGVPPYLVGATVIGVLAQRLVRTLCPSCRQPQDADKLAAERALLDEAIKPWQLKGEYRPYKPVGCLECRHTGYRGRAGLYELMEVGDALQGQIHPRFDAPGLRREAARLGLQPLRVAGAAKVAQGLTTLDEVLRATPRWES
ncbi:MAG TPA: GspE/PulE family protein [Methylibium sp.]|uniref:GspE/PulE family protein n=1 Tax=Methylibium sp. TaxID=2067992 RepID=UPI002DB59451|nr:GspE/PulE family protein [Methylibium sp.]HEU4458786.1 GspE/PulE family protein [Methylibium sp.]